MKAKYLLPALLCSMAAHATELQITFDSSGYLKSTGMAALAHDPFSITMDHAKTRFGDDPFVGLKNSYESSGNFSLYNAQDHNINVSFDVSTETGSFNGAEVTVLKYDYVVSDDYGSSITASSIDIVLPDKDKHLVEISPLTVKEIHRGAYFDADSIQGQNGL